MSAGGERYDAIVIGSGFGGSVSAYRLREAGLDVLLLERGKAWPPGSFPRSPRQLSQNFWDPSKGLYGFFDVWTFDGIESLVSSCLGGGSIIYANVLIRKDPAWFVHETGEDWAVTREELDPHYDRVEKVIKPQAYPFDGEPYSTTSKTTAMRDAANQLGLDWRLPNLAVTFGNPGRPAVPGEPISDGDNRYGVQLYTCRLCGECNIGCNLGSKNTLDLNYLTLFERDGGEIRTLAEAKTITPREGGGYTVGYRAHGEDGAPTREVSADRVVVSAGSYGSTYLLLQNRDRLPNLSPRLGSHWCGNGDLLGFLAHSRRPLDPQFGPVITSAIRYEGENGRGYYIEDGGYPNFVNWMLETADAPGQIRRATRFAWRWLKNKLEKRPVSNLSAEFSALLGDSVRSSGSLPLLGMGRDVPDGNLSVEDGWLQNDWTMTSSRAYYDSVKRSMQGLAGALGAKFVDEPLWYFKRVVTVHPVGGCPMSRSPEEGVVDPNGQVFGHPGLSVADGSVLPGPVGPNPSLTIAALADRFADWIVAQPRA
jgi:cholesterol oxidase